MEFWRNNGFPLGFLECLRTSCHGRGNPRDRHEIESKNGVQDWVEDNYLQTFCQNIRPQAAWRLIKDLSVWLLMAVLTVKSFTCPALKICDFPVPCKIRNPQSANIHLKIHPRSSPENQNTTTTKQYTKSPILINFPVFCSWVYTNNFKQEVANKLFGSRESYWVKEGSSPLTDKQLFAQNVMESSLLCFSFSLLSWSLVTLSHLDIDLQSSPKTYIEHVSINLIDRGLRLLAR